MLNLIYSDELAWVIYNPKDNSQNTKQASNRPAQEGVLSKQRSNILQKSSYISLWGILLI